MQKARWQQFGGCSEILPTAIPLSPKSSVVSKLCVWTVASQGSYDPKWLLCLLCPYWITVLWRPRHPMFLGVFKLSPFFKINRGFSFQHCLLQFLISSSSRSMWATAFPPLFEQQAGTPTPSHDLQGWRLKGEDCIIKMEKVGNVPPWGQGLLFWSCGVSDSAGSKLR